MRVPFFVMVVGPTAVGKSDFVSALGLHLPIEIINGDVGQCYTPLTIGTAKPDWRGDKTEHHLFDCVDEPRDLTVVEYRQKVLECIAAIRERGNIPVVVGGSGFYVKSLLFPPHMNSAGKTGAEALKVQEHYSWDLLHSVDPVRAQKIHKNDHYRISRALEIVRATGMQASTFVPVYNPPMPFICVRLTRGRPELYKRIDDRVDQMFVSGWLEEVRQLTGSAWESFLQNKKIIGYDLLLELVRSKIVYADLTSVKLQIKQRTRNYAKRQLTFFGGLIGQIENSSSLSQQTATIMDYNLTLAPLDLYIKQLSHYLIKVLA